MEGFDEFGRPNWDTLWMGLCFLFAQRSLDEQTKHGCVVVGESNTLLSVGYNSPPRGCNDKDIPKVRPAKYNYMRHAEENAISNAARVGTSLFGSTFYITGHPCHNCFGMIKNVGAKRIVYGDVDTVSMGEESKKVIEDLQKVNEIEVVKFDNDLAVSELLGQAGESW
jgi:dCMP deaminase